MERLGAALASWALVRQATSGFVPPVKEGGREALLRQLGLTAAQPSAEVEELVRR
jgi:hypothetical protein